MSSNIFLIEMCQRWTPQCTWRARTHLHSKANQKIQAATITILNKQKRVLPLALQWAFIVVFVANFIQVGNQLFECFTIDDQTSYTIFWIANDIGRTQIITNKREKKKNKSIKFNDRACELLTSVRSKELERLLFTFQFVKCYESEQTVKWIW